MSSWYVWAAIGMYPETPGRADLVLASPFFAHVSVTLGCGGRSPIEIDAPERRPRTATCTVARVSGIQRARRWLGRPAYSCPWLPASVVYLGRDVTLALGLDAEPVVGHGAGPRTPVDLEEVMDLVDRHRRACDGFSNIAAQLHHDQWDLPTPCTEWDARAVVEHVIGFHEFLLLRPLGVRAHRPQTDPAARWSATSVAMFAALDTPGTLDRETDSWRWYELAANDAGGAHHRRARAHMGPRVWREPRSRARRRPVRGSPTSEACASGMGVANHMHAEIPVRADADAPTRLIVFERTRPDWQPPRA